MAASIVSSSFRSAAAAGVLVLLLLPLIVHTAGADFEGFDLEESDIDDGTPVEPVHLSTSPCIYDSGQRTSQEISTPTSTPPPPRAVEEEVWDEDEFEGFPSENPNPTPESDLLSDSVVDDDGDDKFPKLLSLKLYVIEISCVAFIVAFVVNYFIGKKENEGIALAWVKKFATRDSIFDKNFSLLGMGDNDNTPLLLKERQDSFKFYACGRRFCLGLYATIDLKSRHDLIARMVDWLVAREDRICFEVVMDEDAMDQVELAVVRRTNLKEILREERDLGKFAGVVATAPARRKWVSEDVVVLSELKEVAGDLLTDVVLDQVFGEKAFENLGKGFISLHFSDQHQGSHKKMLMFKFALPNTKKMGDITGLMALVPYYIDLIGRYKLSSQARSKTEAARLKAAQEAHRKLQNARQEALQKKGEKRRLMEVDTKISAEAIRKKEEKERARLTKKASKS